MIALKYAREHGASSRGDMNILRYLGYACIMMMVDVTQAQGNL